MQYVMSDIRGDFDAYEAILQKISFSDRDDVLYLAGNTVGAGGDSRKLILDLVPRANVYPVWGGEDLRAAKYLRLLGEKNEEKNLASLDDAGREAFARWLKDGGNAVLEEFRLLDEEDRSFWREAAENSRRYLHVACSWRTGLAPNMSGFDGHPLPVPEGQGENPWAMLGQCYFSDAYRVAINISLDHLWFGKDPWQRDFANTLQRFVYENPAASQHVLFPDGRVFDREPIMHPLGMQASWACASLASDGPHRLEEARKFFAMPLRTDKRRYYDNCLYFFTLLALSGNYRIYG